MQLQEIKIFPWFEITKPSAEKMCEKEKEFQETGLLPTEIILDDQNRLLDGYISYLLAVKYGLEDVPVKYGRRQVIKAHHKEHGKRYEWELPERLIDQVAAGDKVMIRNTRGLRSATPAFYRVRPAKEIFRVKIVYFDFYKGRKECLHP